MKWLCRAAYERGYEDAMFATSRSYPIPLIHDASRTVVGNVKAGYEWIAVKASRQNVTDWRESLPEGHPERSEKKQTGG